MKRKKINLIPIKVDYDWKELLINRLKINNKMVNLTLSTDAPKIPTANQNVK